MSDEEIYKELCRLELLGDDLVRAIHDLRTKQLGVANEQAKLLKLLAIPEEDRAEKAQNQHITQIPCIKEAYKPKGRTHQ